MNPGQNPSGQNPNCLSQMWTKPQRTPTQSFLDVDYRMKEQKWKQLILSCKFF